MSDQEHLPTCCPKYSDFTCCGGRPSYDSLRAEVERLKGEIRDASYDSGWDWCEEHDARLKAESALASANQRIEELEALVQNDYKALWEADRLRVEELERALLNVAPAYHAISRTCGGAWSTCNDAWCSESRRALTPPPVDQAPR